ncbi:NUMOD4 domain-containing protein [Tsukamurella ocularis]|uniref:NUMOD4 domain-containing protein n=1 Tax=Tsukamurella ocularis TaxID=1970234 RepID=UPI0039F0FE6C
MCLPVNGEPAESWAPIPDSTHYEVSDLGNVRSVTHRSVASNGIPRTIEGKPIARLTTENGSPYVSIRRDAADRPTNRRIAALVLAAHAGPAPQGARPRVINGDRSDVRLANLEWAGPTPPKPKTPRIPRAAVKRAAPVRAPRPPKPAPAPPTEAVIDLTGLPTLNPNSRLHWSSRNRAVNEIRTVVALRARQAGIPTGLDHVHVEFHLRPAREWDDDNVWGAGLWKAAADALHARGKGWKHPVVADDTRAHMTRTPAVQHPIRPGQEPAAWLVIRWDLNTEKAS